MDRTASWTRPPSGLSPSVISQPRCADPGANLSQFSVGIQPNLNRLRLPSSAVWRLASDPPSPLASEGGFRTGAKAKMGRPTGLEPILAAEAKSL